MDNLLCIATTKRSPDRITIKAGYHKTTMSPQADLHRVPAPKRRRARARLITVKCGYKSSTSLVTLRPDRTYLLRLPHPAPTLSTLTAESRRLSRYVSPGRSVRKESV